MPLVCEVCGHVHGDDPPPACRDCGHARLETVPAGRIPETRSPTTAFVWRCGECGTPHDRREPTCTACGHDALLGTYTDHPDEPRPDEVGVREVSYAGVTLPFDPRTALPVAGRSAVWLVAFGVGVFTLAFGILFAIGGSPRFGWPLVGAGLLAMPTPRRRVGRRLGVDVPWPLLVVGYVVGVIGGLLWYGTAG